MRSIFYFLLLIHLFSCKKEVDANVFTISADPGDFKNLMMENIFSSIELITLENLDDALFYKGDKMYFVNNEYHILDRKSNGIFVFDEKGTFLRSSKHRQGNGPGEYYVIADFHILDDKFIEILDVSAYKIKRYDADFNFVDYIDIPKEIYPITIFQRLTDDLYAFYSSLMDKTDQIIIYSFKEGKIMQHVKGYLSDPSLTANHTQVYPFYEFDKEIFFSYPYSNDIVYRIDQNGNIKEVVKYDFGEYNFPFSEAGDYSYAFNDIMKGSRDYIFPTHRYENKNFIFTFVLYKEKQNLILYGKDTNRTESYSCSSGKGNILLPPILIDEDFFYVIAEPNWLEHIIPEGLLSDKSKEIYKDITENNNYVVVKYKFHKS